MCFVSPLLPPRPVDDFVAAVLYMGNLRCRLLLYYVKARSVVCCFEARANAAIKVCPIIVADSRVPFVVRLFWACVALLSQ